MSQVQCTHLSFMELTIVICAVWLACVLYLHDLCARSAEKNANLGALTALVSNYECIVRAQRGEKMRISGPLCQITNAPRALLSNSGSVGCLSNFGGTSGPYRPPLQHRSLAASSWGGARAPSSRRGDALTIGSSTLAGRGRATSSREGRARLPRAQSRSNSPRSLCTAPSPPR